MTATEALTIVAQVFGGIVGKHGEVTGWIKPEDERAVRKVRAKKADDKQEANDGDK
jgi:hypothetical protein